MMHLFAIEEAIQSTALSHRGKCDCTVCRAADGDHAAKAEIYMAAQRA